MAYEPTWHYNTSGNLSNEERLDNVKAVCYYAWEVYEYMNVSTVLALVAWVDYLSLDNPGYSDNGSYSNRGGRGLLLFPRTIIENYAADTGRPWYDGRMQMALLEYYADDIWRSGGWGTYDGWKDRYFSDNDVEYNTKAQLRTFYGAFLSQFIINIPEASYGNDPTTEFVNQLWTIAAHYWPYFDYWLRHEWTDRLPAWLLFKMSEPQKGGRKLLL